MDQQLSVGDSVAGQSDQQPATDEILRFHPWITQELFAETRQVWSKEYGRIISDEEVVEILVNVRRLAEALLHASQSRRVA